MNLFLPTLARWSDLTLFGVRALTGAFLMHETLDNVSSRARMGEFVQFLGKIVEERDVAQKRCTHDKRRHDSSRPLPHVFHHPLVLNAAKRLLHV